MKFIAFCPKFSPDSYLKFKEKLFRVNFSEILWKTKAWKICEISPYFLQFFSWVHIALKIWISIFICCLHPSKEARPKKSPKLVIEKKSRTYCFRKTGFVHSRSGSDYALFLGSFGLKILPDIRHCIYWVLGDIWAPESSHKIFNKFCIHHCQGWKECLFLYETVWFFS